MKNNDEKLLRYSWDSFFQQNSLEIVARKWDSKQCANFPAHDHSFIEIVIICEGKIIQQSVGGTTELKKGDIVVLRPGSWHAYGKADTVKAYNLCFTQQVLNVHLPTITHELAIHFLLRLAPMISGNHGIFNFRITVRQITEIEKIVEGLQADRKRNHHKNDVEKLGLLAICLASLGDIAYRYKGGSIPTYITSHPLARKALKLIEQDISAEHTLSTLAGTLKTNKSYLARIFKQTTGFSAVEYIRQRRCEIAAAMLLSTEMPINEIAQNVGYVDQNYFSRCFKKHFGVSANKYRLHSHE